MTDLSQLPYRPNVCIIVMNAAGQLLLCERAGTPSGVWQFPQGGVEEGHTLEETVLKEAHEELGIDPAKLSIMRKLESTNEYTWEKPPEYAVGRWRGQSQSFWLVKFAGVDSDIKLDLYEPELAQWRWCSPAEVRALAEPRRLSGYEGALREIEGLLRSQRPIQL